MNGKAGNMSKGHAGSHGTKAATPAAKSLMKQTGQAIFQLQKILVPLDFSSCSRKALDYALPFARQFGAELILLHVIEPIVAIPVTEVLPETDFMKESTPSVRRNLEELRATVDKGINTRTLIRTGCPHLEIIDTAKELGIDLVILSTHGRTGLEHVLMGSTAERVVRRIGCPVLVVREYEHDFIHVSNVSS